MIFAVLLYVMCSCCCICGAGFYNFMTKRNRKPKFPEDEDNLVAIKRSQSVLNTTSTPLHPSNSAGSSGHSELIDNKKSMMILETA